MKQLKSQQEAEIKADKSKIEHLEKALVDSKFSN